METPDPNEKASLLEENPTFVLKSAIDSHGRRSMVVPIPETGEMITNTELWERNMPGPENADMRRFMRRMDQGLCWFMFENWREGRVKEMLQLVCLPLLFLYIAYCHTMMAWETRGQRGRTDQQNGGEPKRREKNPEQREKEPEQGE